MDKEVKLSELVLNSINPRTMTEYMQDKLTQSLLVSPWLMKVKPIMIDEKGTVWSGNARTTSLRKIVTMDIDTIEDFMTQQKVYREMDEKNQKRLLKYWKEWKKEQKVPVRTLEGFTDDEKKELLVKDNMHAGEDDAEVLRKYFDRDMISDFFGSVSWDLYDYSDKINDEGAEKNHVRLKSFKCGYVDFFLTDTEYGLLEKDFNAYKEKNNDSSEGYLAHLLGDEELCKEIRDAAISAQSEELSFPDGDVADEDGEEEESDDDDKLPI